MRILAIETADPPGSLALAESAEIVAFRVIEPPSKTTESFAEIIYQMFREADWSPHSIKLVATTQGPGSFTGTRIGVTTAKVFAYATGAAAVGVNTLELIASQSTADGDLSVVMDAQRGQLFVSRFRKRSERLEEILPTSILDNADWLQSLTPSVHVMGPGLRKIADRLPDGQSVADESEWRPRADALARLSHSKFQNGVRHDMWTLTPNYYRKSAAEERTDEARK